jgi:hypothetical protein
VVRLNKLTSTGKNEHDKISLTKDEVQREKTTPNPKPQYNSPTISIKSVDGSKSCVWCPAIDAILVHDTLEFVKDSREEELHQCRRDSHVRGRFVVSTRMNDVSHIKEK